MTKNSNTLFTKLVLTAYVLSSACFENDSAIEGKSHVFYKIDFLPLSKVLGLLAKQC